MSIDIAREVTAALAEAESVRPDSWKWAKGVVLFPETRCPYCREVVRSKAIWVVRGNSLIGQAVPRAGRALVLDPPRHPHATPSDICMGNAVDPLQALFTGLNPKSVFVDMIEWLQGKYWEHSCDAMDVVREEDGDEDHSHEFFCEGCEDDFPEGDSYEFYNRYYCRDCFNERAFTCEGCRGVFSQENRYSGESGSEDYCENCYYDKYFRCDKCEAECEIDERYNDDGSTCYSCAVTECALCEEDTPREEVKHCNICDQNLCEACAEDHEHLFATAHVELESLGQEQLPL